jgi:hypothetical protein
MASVKFKAILHTRHDKHAVKPAFIVFMSDMSDYGYIQVGEPVEFEFQVPDDFDTRDAELSRLEKEEKGIRAAFTARITELQRQKAQLLAIENTVEA